MKTFFIFVVLILYARSSYSKNLDEGQDTSSSTNGPTTTTSSSSPKIVEKSTTTSTSTSSTILPEKSSPQLNSSLNVSSNTPDVIVKTPEVNATFIDSLSNQIRIILKHFQNPDPIGIPGENILPEPMNAENVTVSLTIATGNFYDITIFGLNNFTIDYVDTFLDRMEVFVVLKLKSVIALGYYTMSGILIDNQGPFNISFTNVTVAGTVGLAIDEEGKVYANKSVIDIAYEQLDADLTNVSSLIRPFLNTVGSHVFDAEKPLIMESVNKRLLAEINRRLEFFPRIPPLTKLSPVDLAVLEARRYVRNKYEPLNISKIFDFDNSFLNVHVGPVALNGVWKFARVGNITLGMVNQTVDLRIRIITEKLFGSCLWYYDIGKVGVNRHGQSNFSINHLQFEARVLQSIDSRKSPKLEELEIETGPVLVKMDGQGSFDYLIEMVASLLPKMLQHLIVDSLEDTVKEQIQTEILNKINVEQVYEDTLPDLKKYLVDEKYVKS